MRSASILLATMLFGCHPVPEGTDVFDTDLPEDVESSSDASSDASSDLPQPDCRPEDREIIRQEFATDFPEGLEDVWLRPDGSGFAVGGDSSSGTAAVIYRVGADGSFETEFDVGDKDGFERIECRETETGIGCTAGGRNGLVAITTAEGWMTTSSGGGAPIIDIVRTSFGSLLVRASGADARFASDHATYNPLAPTRLFESADCIDDGKVCAGVTESSLFLGENGGQMWQDEPQLSPCVECVQQHVSMVGPDAVFVARGGGEIWSWIGRDAQVTAATTPEDVRDLVMFNEGLGYAVSDGGGGVYRTTDGANWQLLPFSDFDPARAVRLHAADRGWIVTATSIDRLDYTCATTD